MSDIYFGLYYLRARVSGGHHHTLLMDDVLMSGSPKLYSWCVSMCDLGSLTVHTETACCLSLFLLPYITLCLDLPFKDMDPRRDRGWLPLNKLLL